MSGRGEESVNLYRNGAAAKGCRLGSCSGPIITATVTGCMNKAERLEGVFGSD
jgi:hypothetical protein